MNLPPIDVIHRNEDLATHATAFEIAQLHCLRSIAVSLENLVRIQGLNDTNLHANQYAQVMESIIAHSVRKSDSSIS